MSEHRDRATLHFMNGLVAAALTLSSGLSLIGARVDGALGRYVAARNQQETMIMVAIGVCVAAIVGAIVYVRRKK